MILLIISLPLLGFLGGSLFGRFLGFGTCFVTTGSVFSSLILSFIFFFNVLFFEKSYKLILGS